MNLPGQAGEWPHRTLRTASGAAPADGGFVMVAMLVAIAITAVWMAAALPSWRQQALREKEAELIFRGEAIARAIYLYRQKNGQALPPSIDILVSQRYLRKKYKDPITDKDFLVVGGAATTPGTSGGGTSLQGGLVGVRSTSNDTSIRIYNNQQTYSQWAFDFTLEQMKAGAGLPLEIGAPGGVGRPGGPGGPGQQGPGGRGRQGGLGGRGNGGRGDDGPIIPGRGGRGFGGPTGRGAPPSRPGGGNPGPPVPGPGGGLGR